MAMVLRRSTTIKRKVDWDEEEGCDYEDPDTSEEECDSKEPQMKDVLESLSKAVSKQKASDLLNSMAASKTTCFGHLMDNYSEIST